jgi:PAS domain S-box-containing protein
VSQGVFLVDEQPGYSKSISRRVVGLFLLFAIVIFFPAALFVRSWLVSSYHKFDQNRLEQSYRSFSFDTNERRQLLEILARIYARDPAVIASLSGSPVSAATELVTLKQRAELDLLSVLDESGQLLGGDSNADIFDMRPVARQKWLASFNGLQVSGFIYDRAGHPWLLSVMPIDMQLAGNRRRGIIMAGFILDAVLLEKLGQEIDAVVKFVPKELAEAGSELELHGYKDYRAFWQELIYGQQPYVIFRMAEDEGERVCLGAILRDIQGDSAALLLLKDYSVPFPWSPRALVVFVWLAVFLFGAFVYLILRTLGRRLTEPLAQLRGAIREIAASGNFSQRLSAAEADEIGGLFVEFNAMMQSLEDASEKLKRSSSELSSLYSDLLDQKKFTSEILSMAPSIVLVLLPDGRVKYVNEAIERIAGFKTEEVIGRNWFDNFLPFRIRDDVRHTFEDILKEDMSKSQQHENEILVKYGSERTIFWSNSFFTDKAEKVVSILSIGQDITGLKKVEAELRQKMRDLERFHEVTMNREKRVIELKKEVVALRAQVASLTKAPS